MTRFIEEVTNVPADARLPTAHGDFRIRVFHDQDGLDHVALTLGDMAGPDPVLVRHIQNVLPAMHWEAFDATVVLN